MHAAKVLLMPDAEGSCQQMNIATVTTLYPNAQTPHHGIFVETRLRHLLAAYPQIHPKVVAPVPWFPFSHPRFGRYADYARVPLREHRHGIDVLHPRYLVIPKMGMWLTPLTLAVSVMQGLRQLHREGFQLDLVDAHYLYPDGVAVAWLKRWLDCPFVVTARGTDINLIPRSWLPRRFIRQVFGRAGHLVSVCQALADEMIRLGAPRERLSVLRNGVDLRLFAPPADRSGLRRQLQAGPSQLLSVGHLIERKGHHLVIQALARLGPDYRLWIAGDGPERGMLQSLAERLGVARRVTFLGSVSQSQLSQYYGAADLLVLASSREGWANVLLEAMACGTPVVATKVWGTPEVVAEPVAGELVVRSPEAIAAGITRALAGRAPAPQVRHYAEQFGWQPTSEGLFRLFKQLIGEHP